MHLNFCAGFRSHFFMPHNRTKREEKSKISNAFSPKKKKMPCPEKAKSERKRRFDFNISVIRERESDLLSRPHRFSDVLINFFSAAPQFSSRIEPNASERAVTRWKIKNKARVNATCLEKHSQTPRSRRNFPFSRLKNHHQCPDCQAIETHNSNNHSNTIRTSK